MKEKLIILLGTNHADRVAAYNYMLDQVLDSTCYVYLYPECWRSPKEVRDWLRGKVSPYVHGDLGAVPTHTIVIATNSLCIPLWLIAHHKAWTVVNKYGVDIGDLPPEIERDCLLSPDDWQVYEATEGYAADRTLPPYKPAARYGEDGILSDKIELTADVGAFNDTYDKLLALQLSREKKFAIETLVTLTRVEHVPAETAEAAKEIVRARDLGRRTLNDQYWDSMGTDYTTAAERGDTDDQGALT